MKQILLKTWLVMLMMCVGVGAWAEVTDYTTGTWPTTGWSTKGGSVKLNNISWTYSTSTYIAASGDKLQVGSKNNPQTSAFTFSTSVSNFGNGAKVTAVKINAYTTATTATYDISVGGSSKQSGSLTTSAKDYTANGLNATSGDIVITLTGSSTSKAMYLTSVTVTYEIGYTGPVDASWSVSPSEIAVKTGKTAAATITTNYDGELIAETNDANIATCSFEDGVLTVTGVSAGTTTISFLGDETSKYNEIEREVTVTVTDPAVFDPSNFVLGDFVENIPAAIDGNITFDFGNYSFEVKKNNGSTPPTVHGTALDMRIYAKGTITISSATKQFDGVVFNISEQGLKRLAPITADCGTVATQTSGDETVTWSSTTPVSSVTFTVGDNANFGSDGSSKAGQLDFVSMSINEVTAPTPQPTNGTLNFVAKNVNGYWATFSSTEDVIFDANDVVVYTVSVDDGSLVMIEANDNSLSCVTDKTKDDGWVTGYYVQAGVGVLINSLENNVNYYYIDTDPYTKNILNDIETDPEYNMLRAASVDKATLANYKFYMLAYGDEKLTPSTLGFYWGAADGAAFASRAGSAYLAIPTSSNVKGFSFSDAEVTGIKNVVNKTNSDVIYNLMGQRVKANAKGIVIVNGKKMLNK